MPDPTQSKPGASLTAEHGVLVVPVPTQSLAQRALTLHRQGVIRLSECSDGRCAYNGFHGSAAVCRGLGLNAADGAILLACVRAGASAVPRFHGSEHACFTSSFGIDSPIAPYSCPVDAALSALEAALR